MMNYRGSYSGNKTYGNRVYSPKRPIRSFEDLEVYQKALSYGVGIARRIGTIDDRKIENKNLSATFDILPLPSTLYYLPSNLTTCALAIALKIATAHSLRFGDGLKATQTLEEAMLGCNITVVLLEQYRDLYNVKKSGGTDSQDNSNTGTGTIETSFFEEHVKGLLALRAKLLRLQMSWKKFSQERD